MFLDSASAAAWLARFGGLVDESGRPCVSPKSHVGFAATLPIEVGRRIALLRSMWLTTVPDQEALVWITDWNIWPSGEHLPLAASLRRALGTDLDPGVAPATIVQPQERDDGISILILCVLFGWDCWLIGSKKPRVSTFFSHDEYLRLFCELQCGGMVRELLSTFGMRAEELRAAASGSGFC
jgi:hypothetical protein